MSWANRYIEALKRGETVTFRPQGRSMEPRIMSGQEVTVAPWSDELPRRFDVVLCEVNGKQYLHLVKLVKADGCIIGNNKGRDNGFTPWARIYGKLVEVKA